MLAWAKIDMVTLVLQQDVPDDRLILFLSDDSICNTYEVGGDAE